MLTRSVNLKVLPKVISAYHCPGPTKVLRPRFPAQPRHGLEKLFASPGSAVAHPFSQAARLLPSKRGITELGRSSLTPLRFPVSATLERPDSTVLPSAQSGTSEAALWTRNLVDVIDNQSVSNVVDGVSPIETRKRLVSGVAISPAGPICPRSGVMPTRAIIDGMAEGVVHVQKQSVAHLFPDLQLEGVVIRVNNVLPFTQRSVIWVEEASRIRRTIPLAAEFSAEIVRHASSGGQ